MCRVATLKHHCFGRNPQEILVAPVRNRVEILVALAFTLPVPDKVEKRTRRGAKWLKTAAPPLACCRPGYSRVFLLLRSVSSACSCIVRMTAACCSTLATPCSSRVSPIYRGMRILRRRDLGWRQICAHLGFGVHLRPERRLVGASGDWNDASSDWFCPSDDLLS